MKDSIKITGMSCDHCVRRVTKALEALEGVTDVRVDLEAGVATFERSGTVSREDIRKAIQEAGYTASG